MDKDYVRAYNAKYRQENLEYFRDYLKKYRIENKEKLDAYRIEYRYNEDGTKKAKYLKSMRISNWKSKGMRPLPNETWNDIYKIYDKSKNCMGCDCKFKNKTKCLDHDHSNGYIRGVLCVKCNNRANDVLKYMF